MGFKSEMEALQEQEELDRELYGDSDPYLEEEEDNV